MVINGTHPTVLTKTTKRTDTALKGPRRADFEGLQKLPGGEARIFARLLLPKTEQAKM